MSLWESAGSTYIEAATAALPAHRVILCGSGFLLTTGVRSQTHLSILETLANVKLTDLLSTSTGPFASATLLDLFMGIIAVLLGWVVSRVLIKGAFELASRSTELDVKVSAATSRINLLESTSMDVRLETIKSIDASLDSVRSRLRRLNGWGELLIGLACSLAIAFYWGNILDLIAAIVLMIASFGVLVKSVRVFLAEYFGPALLKSRLEGKNPPTPLGFDQ